MRTSLTLLAAVLSAGAALFWWLSARVEIRDDVDRFIDDLHKMARHNNTAAILSGCAAFANAVLLMAGAR